MAPINRSRNGSIEVIIDKRALGSSQRTVHYVPQPVVEQDQLLMKRIDQLRLEHPFAGARMLRELLRQEGYWVCRSHVGTLMKRMGNETLYRKSRATKSHPEHKIYPYLLRNLEISRPNKVWAMDLTYIQMAKGFVYLFTVLDWYSRRVLAWKLSPTMDVHCCLEAMEEAIGKDDAPEILNTDQDSQFTSQALTGLLQGQNIRVNMGSKGFWRDKVFVEWFDRSVECENIYLHAYKNIAAVRSGLQNYFWLHNSRRSHFGIGDRIPDQVYIPSLPQPMAA